MSFSIKTVYSKTLENYRFNVDKTISMEELKAKIVEKNHIEEGVTINLSYVDSEGDFISLSTTEDFQVAQDLFKEKNSLKIFVRPSPRKREVPIAIDSKTTPSGGCLVTTGTPGPFYRRRPFDELRRRIHFQRHFIKRYLSLKFPRPSEGVLTSGIGTEPVPSPQSLGGRLGGLGKFRRLGDSFGRHGKLRWFKKQVLKKLWKRKLCGSGNWRKQGKESLPPPPTIFPPVGPSDNEAPPSLSLGPTSFRRHGGVRRWDGFSDIRRLWGGCSGVGPCGGLGGVRSWSRSGDANAGTSVDAGGVGVCAGAGSRKHRRRYGYGHGGGRHGFCYGKRWERPETWRAGSATSGSEIEEGATSSFSSSSSSSSSSTSSSDE